MQIKLNVFTFIFVIGFHLKLFIACTLIIEINIDCFCYKTNKYMFVIISYTFWPKILIEYKIL